MFLAGKKMSVKNKGYQNGQASGEDIEDGTMIQIMANENMSEWGHSIIVIDETVKVTKKFLENNPNFCVGKKLKTSNNSKLASGKDIAEFLGWLYLKVFGVGLRLKIIVL